MTTECMETVEMNIDAFYDMAANMDLDDYENSFIFDTKDGRIFIGRCAPGRFLHVKDSAMPIFWDGKYLGVGYITGAEQITDEGPSPIPALREPDIEELEAVAEVKLIGNPEKWEIVSDK